MIATEEKRTTGELLSIVFVMAFAFFSFGIALLFLVMFHDTIVEYNKEIKWFNLLIISTSVLIFFVFIGGHAHLSLRKRYMEILAYEQNNLLPSTLKKSVTIEQKAAKEKDDKFITFTDSKTHEFYCEMIETDTFSLNRLAIEIYGNTGGEYNKKLRASLEKFGVNI